LRAGAVTRVVNEWIPNLTYCAPVQLAAYVVEDNADIRENLAGTLQELTCVTVVGCGATEEEALQWLEHGPQRWDIAILDLFLKAGSGIRLLQRLKQRRPGQKIVVFSNYVNAGVRKRCAQLGVDAVFDKSTEIDALVDYCAHQCSSGPDSLPLSDDSSFGNSLL
jgi:two-component system OmpR family response regulator